ncbi:MAG: mechanosensitive ion channel family protein [Candidatus Bathyarchaeota archaeon]|nr:mechanosensitive ion channel family protein [Candidatus Bathyarchaeota archaeon]
MNKIVWATTIILIVVAMGVITYFAWQWGVLQELGILDFVTSENMTLALKVIIVLVGAIVADRVIGRMIKRYSRRIGLVKHIENMFKVTARIVIFAVAITIILPIFKIDTGVILSISALSGAAIGFAATQTVGNFLAGLYIMISRPFTVSDYVKIGDVEGQVREITVNYTKIYMPTYNFIEIPNRQVLDSRILNYSKKNIVDYTFRVGFPSTLPGDITNTELMQDCIAPVINSFYERQKKMFVKKPELAVATDYMGYMGSVGLDRLQRTFAVRVFFKEKDVEAFYDLQPQLLNEIIKKWDEYSKKVNKDV